MVQLKGYHSGILSLPQYDRTVREGITSNVNHANDGSRHEHFEYISIFSPLQQMENDDNRHALRREFVRLQESREPLRR